MIYPDSRVEQATDTLAGVSFHDPYQWLEHATEEVLQWQRAQAELARAHVREWPSFDRLYGLVERFNIPRYASIPEYAAGRWFRTRAAKGTSVPEVIVSNEPMGEGRVLFRAVAEDAGQSQILSWIAPSPDGKTLAVGVCIDGSENNKIRLIDVDTGELLPNPPSQTLMDNWTRGVQWLPDSSGFFFSAIDGIATEFDQDVYLHRRFPTQTTVRAEVAWTKRKSYKVVTVSRDGLYAVAMERPRTPIPVAIARLGASELRWRPFITAVEDTVAGHVLGDRYIAITSVGAPRGRLVSIPLDAADPNDHGCWHELVRESEATMRTVTPVGELLYLTEFVDSYARVRIVDCRGRIAGEVPLPGRGAIVSERPTTMTNLLPSGHREQFVFGFSSLTVSTGIYRHIPGQSEIETLQEPQVRLEHTLIEDRWAVSKDGTRIPYRLVHRRDPQATKPRPTLIWGYGGFNLALVPQFPGPMAAFIEAGGVFVHAHLRGGGEFGLEWWSGGRKRNKQNTFDDLYAVAEDLIEAGISTPRSLAVTGTSAGGLLAGIAAIQRPDLWSAVVARVPVLDLIHHCHDAYGRMMFEEFVDADDPEDVRRLGAISPYHLVRKGVRYPAVFIDAGDSDPRAPAWHARKFAARLQQATASEAPVLLHVWEGLGHGPANDKASVAIQNTEWLAFTLRHLGVNDWR